MKSKHAQVAPLLADKHLVVCVGGSIAAYKACDLVRLLRREGATITVIMSEGAQAFIKPLSLQALSGRPVVCDRMQDSTPDGMMHITLARQADAIVIAPASAQQMAELAHGFAHDLIGCAFLAAVCPRLIAPAMNTHMWQHAATRANCAKLVKLGYDIIAPTFGEQACGDIGDGKLAPLEAIVHAVVAATCAKPLIGKQVLVTAGGTKEWLDPVRFLSNASSGKTGVAFAHACYYLGADVKLVIANSVQSSYYIQRFEVETAREMLAAVLNVIGSVDMCIATAAVADFRPSVEMLTKYKKRSKSATLEFTCVKNPDILAGMCSELEKQQRLQSCFLVGFAAETDNVLRNAQQKLAHKKLDCIIANQVGKHETFAKDSSCLFLLTPNGSETCYSGDKKQVALALMEDLAELCTINKIQDVQQGAFCAD